jgi:uncharacterized YceG family protein
VAERLTTSGQRRPSNRRAPNRRAPNGRGSNRRVFVVRRIVAVTVLIAAAVVIWFLIELFQPLHGPGQGRVRVTIPKSAGVDQIATILSRDGVIDSGFFFKLRVALDGDRGKLRAGTYELSHGMSYSGVIKALTTPPPPVPVSEVTIIPGRTRRQLDALLRSQGVRGSYLRSTIRSPALDPTAYGAPQTTPSLEGFLFPDTYQLREPISIPALVADQLRSFKQQFARVNMSYARSRHLTPYDVLIIGSLIEGESRLPSDGPKVASVIYNRLRDGMDLGLDSTVSYATGNYTPNLTTAQLNSPSPWNTRNHAGLPPTPIDSPSLQSIYDAAHPARTNYLYFVNKVCGNGALAFTRSYQTFLRLSAAYQAASVRAERRPGASPEFCKPGSR